MDVSDSLVIVPKEEWPSLINKFKQNWPFGLTAYNTLLTQCIYVTKFPDFPVEIFSVFGDPDNGIVCVWSLIPNAYEISVFCMKEDTSKITKALVKTKHINWTYRILFCILMEDHIKCVRDALAQLGRTNLKVNNTHVAYLDKEIGKNYEIKHPESGSLKVLPAEMADEVDKEWPHRYPGSLDYFRKMLETEAAIGVVNGDLRAWCLTSVRGDLHALHTKMEHRRKGYARLLVKTLSKQLAEDNREIYVCILLDNEASVKMFTALGFKFVFTVTWIETKLENEIRQ